MVGDLVECLFPFQGPAAGPGGPAARKAPPPPRLAELAALAECEAMLAEGDPDGDGLWPLATPTILAALPPALARTRQVVYL